MRPRPLLVLALLALAPAVLAADDVIETYGLDRTQVEQSISGVYRGGWFAFDVGPALRALAPAERPAAVRALGAFARAYVHSDAFKEDYAKAYQASKPKGLGLRSLDAGRLAKQALDQAQGQQDAAARTALDQDPDVTLRRRLREFLDLSATVDFDAVTKGTGSSRRFEKAEYEAKPNEWKMCFRAGREATTAARASAQEWLDQLGPERH